MSKILIVCQSITGAQKIMNLLTKQGFWASILRTPSCIRLKNCSYSVMFYQKDSDNIKNLLKSRNIEWINAYLYDNGIYKKIGGDFT